MVDRHHDADHLPPPSSPAHDKRVREPAERFAVSHYVPPPPRVEFTDRVCVSVAERAQKKDREQKKGRRRRVIGWVVLGVGVLILAASAWVGWRTYQAYSHLQSASDDVSQLQAQLQEVGQIDPVRTGEIVGHLQSEAADAQSAVDDPLFGVAAALPWIGPNLDAIREITGTVNALSADVMPSLVTIASTLQPEDLAPQEGQINLAPIEEISPLLQRADQVVNESIARMAAIDRSSVVSSVDEAVLSLSDKLVQASAVTETGARVARLLPPMLGADGPRTYLVVFQNLAEPRATGGIFGSYAVVQADQGKIEIMGQSAASRSLGFFDPAVGDLTPEQLALYSPTMAQFPMDVNFTPDFPTAAALFAQMHMQRKGGTVDGVMSIDPVALSYTLEGTGPVPVGNGVVLTSDNVVDYLLSDVYQDFTEDVDQAARDDFLAQATGKAFATVMSGEGDAGTILNGLERAMQERRLLVWSTDQAEEADLSDTSLGGSLDSSLERPTIGVFLNDGTGGKLGYYLDNGAKVLTGQCQPDGSRELELRITMSNTAPATGLPPYVLGIEAGGQGILRNNVLVFAPIGGTIVSATRDGEPWPLVAGVDHFHAVAQGTVDLASGQETEIIVKLLTAPGDSAESVLVHPELLLTPGVRPWETSVEDYRTCRPSTG